MPSERVKVAGTEIPLTKMQARLVGALAVVGVAVLVATQAAKLPYFQPRIVVETSPRASAEMVEMQRHFAQVPEKESIWYDDQRGRYVSRLYGDLCLIHAEAATDPLARPIFSVTLGPGRREAIQAEIDGGLLSTPAFAAEPCWWPGCWRDDLWGPHPDLDASRSGAERRGKCALRIWRRFADGCEHYQDVDECTGWAAAVCWTKCAGH